jgi:acyl carrier protein
MKSAVIMPQTEFERQISRVLQDAFNRDSLSIYDNFFDLGANSLLLIQVHEKLQEILGVKFSITKMFEFPTIQSLAAFLGNTKESVIRADAVQERVDRRMDARKRRQALKQRRIVK